MVWLIPSIGHYMHENFLSAASAHSRVLHFSFQNTTPTTDDIFFKIAARRFKFKIKLSLVRIWCSTCPLPSLQTHLRTSPK
jgi:hypothetical protein